MAIDGQQFTRELQRTIDAKGMKIRRSLTRSLDTWWQFFDDIERQL